MVAGVIDAAFGPALDEVLEEGEALENDAPSGRAGGFNGLPHELTDDQDWWFDGGKQEGR